MNRIKLVTSFLIAAIILASCSTSKVDNFSSRKYTNFKKGATAININNKVKTTKPEVGTKEVLLSQQDGSDISNNKNIQVLKGFEANTPTLIANNNKISNELATNINNKTNKKLLEKIIKPKVQLLNKAITRSILTNSSAASVPQSYSGELLLVILAIALPPLAVYLYKGIGTDFWIDLVLTLLAWLPGIIYALIVIFS